MSYFLIDVREPKTPIDPCDRVKFILGTDESDQLDQDHVPHTIFTELEELKYDEHDHKYVKKYPLV